ncbi:hypothetical protein BP6252_04114 [Coleophoma cylindrospora]|uniref:Uncharacterized protein n=1 Tax=Coleophoma cylindrospora TaxID=1849047 RepID=A0A3D8RZL0_9HELO|nr:hypothetical protein BP6252_04114 [Coleophoma cylindrospora]
MRGGIETFGYNPDFQLKLLLIDIFAAVITNTDPKLPSLYSPHPVPAPSRALGLEQDSVLDSPLYGHRDLDGLLADLAFRGTEIRLLQSMRNLTLAAKEYTINAQDLLTGLRTTVSESDSDTSPLYRIIFHTSLIYSRLFNSPPIPLSSSLNMESRSILIEELESPVNDTTWLLYPGIFLWVLLVAAVATDGSPERAFLTQLFGKIVSVARWGWWREVRESMAVFLEMRRRAELTR